MKRRIEKVAVTGMLACLAMACERDATTEEEAVAIAELVGNVTVGPLVELWVGEAILAGEFNPQGRSRDDNNWTPPITWSEPRGQTGRFKIELECPEGGSVSISGNNKDRGPALEGILGGLIEEIFGWYPEWHGEVGELRAKAKFDHCARTSRDGLTMALTGTVDTEFAKTFIHQDTWVTVGMRGDWSGKVAWENPHAGRSGVCRIDGADRLRPDSSPAPVIMDMSMAVEHGNRSQHVEGGVSGFMCGQPVYTEDQDDGRQGWLEPPGSPN